jgi:ribosomal protection tetracycline resistance protein
VPTLNLGIVAHVDAGKTTLTERLLYDTGVITHIGRVDHGDTTTDTDALERARGITIRSAVVTFTLGDVKINLIDTPGHSDFVAEVERALSVLDGAVLVVSAVEGVQAQTRVLIRILERLQIPFLIFVNKVDRMGATDDDTLTSIRHALAGDAIALNTPRDLGTRAVSVRPRHGSSLSEELVVRLAEYDDELLRRYVDGASPISESEAVATLTRLTRLGRLHPVYFGSAMTGVGVGDLVDGLTRHLPASEEDSGIPLHATVFKIERGRAGHRVAYARLHSGTLTARDQIDYFHRSRTGTVLERHGRATAVSSFSAGTLTTNSTALAGDIAKVVGLTDVEIGDQLGAWDSAKGGRYFAPPGLEAVVQARNPADRPALFEALRELAEQDPLIDTRLDGIDQELTVSLYGEVQKEVLAARLATEFGVEAEFLPTQIVYVERVSGVGEAVEEVSSHNATVGLRIQPGPVGSGFGYRLAVERGWLLPSFHTAIEETLATELEQGLLGWRVVDCFVTLTHARFSAPTPPSGYFRQLTTVALRKAMTQATTTVCEPFSEFEVEFPATIMSRLLQKLSAAGATPAESTLGPDRGRVTGTMPTAAVHAFEQRLPDLTQGRGVFFTRPAGYLPVQGAQPRRGRSPLSDTAVDGTRTG